MYMCVYLSLSLSLYVYIHICMYIYSCRKAPPHIIYRYRFPFVLHSNGAVVEAPGSRLSSQNQACSII